MAGRKLERLCLWAGAGVLALSQGQQTWAQSTPPHNGLEHDHGPSLKFSGSRSAELFTRELEASLDGALNRNFVAHENAQFPAGFVNASLPGFPWAGTMWTRDGGTFMRELVMRGYLEHASLLAECLMSLVEKNDVGFYAFPEYFKGRQRAAGAELDGTASIVLGMVLLWERLPEGNPTRVHIESFLSQPSSPVKYFGFLLQQKPLLAGTGEFGCGWRFEQVCDNVVQNNLVRLALLASATMANARMDTKDATEYRREASVLADGMQRYLTAADGSWLWCIDPKTMKPDPAILNAAENLGVGAQNGVLTMDADLLGLIPDGDDWTGVARSRATFDRLYETPQRKTEFDRYGIWTQFDHVAGGMLTSPSYGQGYSLQAMLLMDKLDMARHGLDWLALQTFQPVPEYQLHRDSKLFFYERMYSPDAVGKTPLEEGCGALNLVNISEPLKVSRLILGVDDSSGDVIRFVPRLPTGWTSVEAHDWPVWTTQGIVRADIRYELTPKGASFTLQLAPGQRIAKLRVRLPDGHGYRWVERTDVHSLHLASEPAAQSASLRETLTQ
jgi:hypothetical protein